MEWEQVFILLAYVSSYSEQDKIKFALKEWEFFQM